MIKIIDDEINVVKRGAPKTAFKKGNKPWNAGKKMSAEIRLKLSIAHRGKKQSPETCLKRSLKMTGDKHPSWAGDNVGVGALHCWLHRHYGKASRCDNPGCVYPRMSARNKYMEKPSIYNWANKSGLYKRDMTDWMQLCISCHSYYDHNKKLPNHIKA